MSGSTEQGIVWGEWPEAVRDDPFPTFAEALGVSRRTGTSHLEHVYTKLGVSSRTEAALFAMRHGLVDDPPDA